jgi:8-hydroxy-5-deazaflavin:NADPH oxidoreductase
MEIGIIGAGAFAQAFAKRALKAGHNVKLSNSRRPDSLGDIVNHVGRPFVFGFSAMSLPNSLREVVAQLGPGATAATKEEAAACEIVLLAVPWDKVPETLASLPKWNNQKRT